uniref:hypothetical protein n=1 Tax=Burkholderia sp. M701 TaxID=326454 RepID=UPI0012EB5B02|nr:hypothetical protein [Burkholderia sp. M701]
MITQRPPIHRAQPVGGVRIVHFEPLSCHFGLVVAARPENQGRLKLTRRRNGLSGPAKPVETGCDDNADAHGRSPLEQGGQTVLRPLVDIADGNDEGAARWDRERIRSGERGQDCVEHGTCGRRPVLAIEPARHARVKAYPSLRSVAGRRDEQWMLLRGTIERQDCGYVIGVPTSHVTIPMSAHGSRSNIVSSSTNPAPVAE